MDISEKIGLAAELACLLEASAEKPGNVTPTHDFIDTKYEDFLISAAAIGRAFRNVSISTVGETVLQAVKDTRALTGINTNLGIILLFAPLARAFAFSEGNNFRNNLISVLKDLTVKDAELTYEAIRTAAPAGMGRVAEHDVNDTKVTITLLKAMEQAKDRDSIAREYATGYEVVLDIGLPAFRQSLELGASLSDCIIQTFLTILSGVPDTLIARKAGVDTARDVSNRALRIMEHGGVFSERGSRAIKGLDKFLRRSETSSALLQSNILSTTHEKGEKSFAPANALNPGTTADLTAAVLFVYLMENDLKIHG